MLHFNPSLCGQASCRQASCGLSRLPPLGIRSAFAEIESISNGYTGECLDARKPSLEDGRGEFAKAPRNGAQVSPVLAKSTSNQKARAKKFDLLGRFAVA